jgi:hypothetical protein
VPAPAVIPAPIAYIKVVAVKKLVVEIGLSSRAARERFVVPSGRVGTFTLKKLECSKQAFARIH